MKFYVPSPDASARRLLFEKGLQDVGHNLTDEDFDELVEETDGYSARVIAGLVRTAARIPLDDLLSVTDDPAHVREDEIPPVSIEHFREALSQVHHVLPEEDKDALREWMRRVNIPIPQGL
jgi:SpoVK/Ycf46/Vps4 family AAA+-type ATPase